MALGSSAPEILLSVIELFQNKITSGELGPSTIVGSAAFNLFIICGVCVWVIPTSEIRLIKDLAVYSVTAVFSLFAYLWLVIILESNTPNIVDTSEGIITFLMFPLLVIIAYAADRGLFSDREGIVKNYVAAVDMTKEELSEKTAEIRRMHGDMLSDDAVTQLIREYTKVPPTRAHLRVEATRRMFGGKKIQLAPRIAVARPIQSGAVDECGEPTPSSMIQFKCSHYAVMESVGTMELAVLRTGILHTNISVDFKTRHGSATADADYVHTEGRLNFKPNETEKMISLTIIDDDYTEDKEEFYVDLYDIEATDDKIPALIGPSQTATVTIIDDDLPGVLSWDNDFKEVPEGLTDKVVSFTVQRKTGASGVVSCQYSTEAASALPTLDFEGKTGTLEFAHAQTEATIDILIKARGRYEKSEEFRINLTNITGGALFDADTDGGADSCIMTVSIVADRTNRDHTDMIGKLLSANLDSMKIGTSNWKDQFIHAWYCNGSAEDQQEASLSDWGFHLVTLPWKLFFAFVPPTDYANGWVCFYVALIFIGFVTAIIGDLASLFGCTIDVENSITAFTFVALGTSLPDLFASKQSAIQADTADAAICNITGSNSVNVFLGLGLPWMFGAIFWSYNGRNALWEEKYGDKPYVSHLQGTTEAAFVVESGDLSFSVTVFTSCATACIAIMALRRRYLGGELGGPMKWRWPTCLSFGGLWLIYIILSIVKIKSSD
eukprot:GEMP01003278.1.p1 GENE.GEMP01003278.1~~GEMP01003278.1.p1  ORF type:complete len:829 (+),score=107.15 GEMP01003278.1:321-2489(+)